jgi:acyl-CoA reductase-like NAD-dependent aldehyde dehydrogenase
VGVIASQVSGLLGLVASITPAITGGNTVIVLAPEKLPLTAIEFAEVVHASDVPSGVINILTGKTGELLPQFASHMDINAVVYGGSDRNELKKLEELASLNVKRIVFMPYTGMQNAAKGDPYAIMDLQEIKTTWHPVGT